MSSFNSEIFKIGSRTYEWASGQKIAVGASSAQSSAISAAEVMLQADTDCFINVGSNPTAADSAGSFPLLAGEKFHLQITDGYKVAVIRKTADGSLYILPSE